MRNIFINLAVLIIFVTAGISLFYHDFLWTFLISGPIIGIGLIDILQSRHSIKRNFPIIGHFRYLFEFIRPEINQYFVESDTDGRPINRIQRSIVYERAKEELETIPFGTKEEVYNVGYEFVNHSMSPTKLGEEEKYITVGGKDCTQPYTCSILNISAMSYGALSKNAILALNGGAKDGNFAHNTGEGGLTEYHLKNGGDLILQIGTGYFGFRDKEGHFSEELFQEQVILDNIKMIEIKISQGAKPSHRGFLPAKKVSKEISKIRKVEMGKELISPPTHSEFSTPTELLDFIKKLRKLSNGKPVGIKLCVGHKWEFIAICKAMKKTGILPDYISVDGAEGGTGAAPLEFTNYIGTPGLDGLNFVRNCLVGFGLRDKIKILSSGKITTGFHILRLKALGADIIYAARAMMLSLGCIQALRCHSNACPSGVATQNPSLVKGLVVSNKRKRVKNFHKHTVESVLQIAQAMGLKSLNEITPQHLQRRISNSHSKNYGEIYELIPENSLLKKSSIPQSFQEDFDKASSESFHPLKIS